MNPLLKVNPPRPGLNPLKGKVNPLREILSKQCNKSMKRIPHRWVGDLFHKCLERFECDIAHAGGMCMSQCAHWRIPLFFRTRPTTLGTAPPLRKNAGESLHLR